MCTANAHALSPVRMSTDPSEPPWGGRVEALTLWYAGCSIVGCFVWNVYGCDVHKLSSSNLASIGCALSGRVVDVPLELNRCTWVGVSYVKYVAPLVLYAMFSVR